MLTMFIFHFKYWPSAKLISSIICNIRAEKKSGKPAAKPISDRVVTAKIMQ